MKKTVSRMDTKAISNFLIKEISFKSLTNDAEGATGKS